MNEKQRLIIAELKKLLPQAIEAVKDKGVGSATQPTTQLQKMAKQIVKLLEEKEQAYGNAFDKTDQFLKLLYPEGVSVHQYSDMLFVVRIFDKMMRIANNKKAFNEEPFKDITGYGLLGWRKEVNNCDESKIDSGLGYPSPEEDIGSYPKEKLPSSKKFLDPALFLSKKQTEFKESPDFDQDEE
jgi:hypothetical protein